MIRTISMPRRTALSLVAGAGLSAALPATPLLAAATDAQARRKINFAGRQRMLTQRMSRAVFFGALGAEPTKYKEMLTSAHSLFDKTLKGLHHGDPTLGLPKEDKAIVLESITVVEGLWEAFGANIAGVIARKGASEQELQTIALMNPAVLFASDNVVKNLVEAYGKSTTSLGLAIAINVAGRQRMLSQKMAKETALIALKLDAQGNRERLRETSRLFDNSLTALIEGLPQISLPTPPAHVKLKLQEVKAIWIDLRDTYNRIAEGKDVDAFDLSAISAQSDPLLVTMNDAVTLYEEL